MPGPEHWSTIGLSLACSAAALALYAITACRDIALGDAAEFVTVAVTLGVAHPPGYPILTVLGHLFTLLLPGPLPFRANLVSALAGAGTVGFTCLIGFRLTQNRVAAAGASLLLAIQPLVWQWSLVIEAFALNAFLAAACFYWLLRWDEAPETGRWLALASAALALGAANHSTIACLVPSIGLLIWHHRTTFGRRPELVWYGVAPIVLGLSSYIYLPWAAARHPMLNWGDIASGADLIHHVLRTTYGTFQLSDATQASSPPTERLSTFFTSFTVPEAVLVVLGLFSASRTRTRIVWLLVLAAALAGPGFALASNLNLQVPGLVWVLERFFVLPHVLLAPLMAVAIAASGAALANRFFSAAFRYLSAAAVGSVILVLLALGVVSRCRQLDQSNNHLARHFGEDLLSTVPENAVLMANSDVVTLPVAYLQAAEHRRPDVTLVMLGPLARGEWYIRELRRREPRLRVPFDHYDPSNPTTAIRALVDANPDRPFVLVGAPPDGSLEPAYWLLPHGLGLIVEPRTHDVELAQMEAQNVQLFQQYNPPPALNISATNFDAYVLQAYATGARLVGLQYLAAHRLPDAAAWFRRALSINPLDDASRSLWQEASGR